MRASGTRSMMPSASPSPARRMGTTTSFLPSSNGAFIASIGVEISRSTNGRSLVAS